MASNPSYVPGNLPADSDFLHLAVYLGNSVFWLDQLLHCRSPHWICYLSDSPTDGLRRFVLHPPRLVDRQDGRDKCCFPLYFSPLEALQLYGQDLLLLQPVEVDVHHTGLFLRYRLHRLLHRFVFLSFFLSLPATAYSARTARAWGTSS